MQRSSRKLVVRVVLILAIFAGTGAIVWHKLIKDYVIPRNFGVVEPGMIYRSGRLKTNVLRDLHDEYKLRTIIDLGAFTPGSDEDNAEQQLSDELGMERVRFSLEGDGTGDPNAYVRTLHMMVDPARQPVLVHCSAGAQRTSAAVILYRHLIEGMPIEKAYPESFEYKHEADNYHLLAYLADNIEVIRASYETGRPIVRDPNGVWVLADEPTPTGGHGAESTAEAPSGE